MLRFNNRYFLVSVSLFIIEVLIALFVHDNFIRPYVGDYLVVMLLYCAATSFIKASPLKISLAALLFACFIEVLQYYKITDRLGLSDNVIARTVIGYGFDWWDIVAYVLGAMSVLLLEKLRSNDLSRTF